MQGVQTSLHRLSIESLTEVPM
ncbi:protein traJ, partial [Salmonella enterica subsp. enterica serovar Schwarzengrund]